MEVSLSMMNELQQAEFALLKAFDQVCAKLGLKYFLVCGSALGAAKYRGFIPWDDDIDVALYREDYEIFCAHAAALLPEHLFVQNYRTDPAFPAIYSKLRDSNTTYIEKSARHLPIHHGIFIDVFPLDGYPDGRLARRRLEFFKRLYKHALAAAFSLDRSGGEQLLYLVDRLLGTPKRTAQIARKYTERISRYPAKTSDILCNHGNWQGKLDYAPREQYGDGVWAVFEGLPVRIPVRYDQYLTQKYGDWRADLPPEQQKGHHDYVVCDPKHAYRLADEAADPRTEE